MKYEHNKMIDSSSTFLTGVAIGLVLLSSIITLVNAYKIVPDVGVEDCSDKTLVSVTRDGPYITYVLKIGD